MVDSRANQLPDSARVRDSDHPPEFLKHELERFQTMKTFWSEIHTEAVEDDRMIAGKHWPEKIRKEREDQGRPMLTYNMLPAFCRQITNRVRQNTPQIRVVPVETDRGQSPMIRNVQGTKDYSIADVYGGIIRNIEHRSRAEMAYQTALRHAVHHAFGYFYLANVYARDNPFVQELQIKRVKNSFSVYCDPSAEEADYSDMQDAFMFSHINRGVFEKKYPNAALHEFHPGSEGELYDGWFEVDKVRIARYYFLEYHDDAVVMMTNGKIHFLSDVEDQLAEMERREGLRVAKDSAGNLMEKPIKRPQCMFQKMTAKEVLEGPTKLPFRQIPIFPVLGEELSLDGRIVYTSAIRDAKDAQRSFNYWRTEATETVALAPRAPWLITKRQIKGFEKDWERANTDNPAYLPYNHVDGEPLPQRVQGAGTAAAELANAGQDRADMQSIIGLHEANMGEQGNEKSGVALRERKEQGFTSTYEFPDNLQRAITACARVLVDAIPIIYDTERITRIRMPDDTEDMVMINQTTVVDGEQKLIHDLGYGQYDVIVDAGPSYHSQREQAVETGMELLKVLPEGMAANVVDLVVKNIAQPGSEEIYQRLRKMLPDALKSEDERAADLPKGVVFNDEGQPIYEETGEPYQPELTPEEQAAQQAMQVQQAENEAKMAKAQADVATAEAKQAEAQAKIAEAQRAPEEGEPVDYAAQLLPGIERVIQEAMAEHNANPDAHGASIEEQMINATTDVLRRVKTYVDSRIPELEAEQAAGAADDAAATTTAAAAATEPAEAAGVVVPMPARETRIEFERDDMGRISGAVMDSPAGAKVIDIRQGEEGVESATIRPAAS